MVSYLNKGTRVDGGNGFFVLKMHGVLLGIGMGYCHVEISSSQGK